MKERDERELTERAAYEVGDETESVPPIVPPAEDESESTLSTLFEVEDEPSYGRD